MSGAFGMSGDRDLARDEVQHGPAATPAQALRPRGLELGPVRRGEQAPLEHLEARVPIGANGILLNGIGNYQVGSSGMIIANPGSGVGTGIMNTRTGKEATGVAIYVIEE